MNSVTSSSIVGLGCYGVSQAARLCGIPVRRVRRWLGATSGRSARRQVAPVPLWRAHYLHVDEPDPVELSFRDLIELRAADGLVKHGWPEALLPELIEAGRRRLGDHPLQCLDFPDIASSLVAGIMAGRRLAVTRLPTWQQRWAPQALNDAEWRQGLSYDAERRACLWRPASGGDHVVVNPRCRDGDPVLAGTSVQTYLLYRSFIAERGAADFVASIYGLDPIKTVAAIAFELELER